MSPRATATVVALAAAAAVTWTPIAGAQEPTSGPKCGLHLNESEYGSVYLEPITGRKNISCEAAKAVATDALKAKPKLYCTKKTRYRKWTIRHAGRYEESLSARFTKGNQRFRIQSQGSCK